MVCDYRPLKDEKFIVIITVGGDRLPYHLCAGSPAADLLETKLTINSVISDSRKGARFVCLDIKDNFLVTPTTNPKFMRVTCMHVPADSIARYNIDQLVTNIEWVYVKIQKEMPGLRQSATLAYQHLKTALNLLVTPQSEKLREHDSMINVKQNFISV